MSIFNSSVRISSLHYYYYFFFFDYSKHNEFSILIFYLGLNTFHLKILKLDINHFINSSIHKIVKINKTGLKFILN